MLNLVAPGPKLIVAKTENQLALKQYLQEQFQAVEMEQLGLGTDYHSIKCIVCRNIHFSAPRDLVKTSRI